MLPTGTILEVTVPGLDEGLLEKGDRGVVEDHGTSSSRRVVFRPMIPSFGVLPIYDFREGWVESGAVRVVPGGRAELDEYSERRSEHYLHLLEEHRIDLRGRGFKTRAERDVLDAETLAVVHAMPGLLAWRVLDFCGRITDSQRRRHAPLFDRSLVRNFEAGRIRCLDPNVKLDRSFPSLLWRARVCPAS
jgi:hypothetical protein